MDRIVTTRNGETVIKDCIVCVQCHCCGVLCTVREVEIIRGHAFCEPCLENQPKVIWTIVPIAGKPLAADQVIIPIEEFPANVRLIRCRLNGSYDVHCHIEGDGAEELRKYPIPYPFLRITEVSEISGFGKAVLNSP